MPGRVRGLGNHHVLGTPLLTKPQPATQENAEGQDRQTDKQTRTTLSKFALCLSFVRAGVMMMVMMMAMDGRNSTLC